MGKMVPGKTNIIDALKNLCLSLITLEAILSGQILWLSNHKIMMKNQITTNEF